MLERCIFCKISGKQMDANIVFQNQYVTCFLDIDPINEGHILIIPNEHYLDADELPDLIAVEIMRVSQKILKALKKKYKFPGYSIMQNGGEFNDIGHYHMHIFPRYKNDDFGWTFGAEKANPCNKYISENIKDILSPL